MRRVYLTVGPQFAGKSTFCEKVVAAHPEIQMVSRDKILIEQFGSVWLSPYTGEHRTGWRLLFEEAKKLLQKPDVTLIVDAWNQSYEDRMTIGGKLLMLGADRIKAWHFVTPIERCIEWSFKREPLDVHIPHQLLDVYRKDRAETYTRAYGRFHHMRLEKEPIFNAVMRIDPLLPIPKDLFEIA